MKCLTSLISFVNETATKIANCLTRSLQAIGHVNFMQWELVKAKSNKSSHYRSPEAIAHAQINKGETESHTTVVIKSQPKMKNFRGRKIT